MQLFFIRHAQSQNNLLYEQNGNDVGRHSDPEITETGWQQARILANFIKHSGTELTTGLTDLHNRQGFNFTHIYCSLMVRSIQTGSVLAEALDIPLVALSDLHEGGGIFIRDEKSGELIPLPGNNESYFKKNFPHLILPDDMNKDGWWNRPFEDYQSRCERAARLLSFILKQHAGSEDRVALISHGGFYNYFLREILGCPLKGNASENDHQPGAWLLMNNTAITRVDWTTEETRLVYHNRVDFLPAELIT